MAITNQNIVVMRGDTITVRIDITEADLTQFDPLVPGIDVVYRMAKTAHAPDDETLIRKSLANGITPVGAGNVDAVDVALDVADTDQKPGTYYHELKVFDTVAGDVSTVMTGWFVVKRSLRMGVVAEPAKASLRITTTAPTVS